ncbi:hypothetical protein GCM10023238_05610 [Streptomyces heliomycini]
MEHLRDIHHVSEFDRLEIQHFFEVYKDLEPGKSVEGANWVGPGGRRGGDRAVLQAFQGDRRPLSPPLRDAGTGRTRACGPFCRACAY